MAEIVSLAKARKARDRAAKRAGADANSIKFGQSKAEKSLAKTRADKAARDLDGHHLAAPPASNDPTDPA